MKNLAIARLAAILLLSLGLAGGVFAQKATPTPTPGPPQPADDAGEVIKVDSRLVAIPVAVTDTNGDPVQGLSEKDFRVSEEGHPQKVEKVGTADTVPLEIVLLFDVSASTDAMFRFEQETAAKFLQDVMRPMDRATIFTIGAAPILVQGRQAADVTAAAVRNIKPTKEFTAFYDTVSAAADYLEKNAASGTRRVVVVISDGEDTNSTRIAKAIQDGYRRAGEKVNTLDNKALYALTVANRNEASMKERTRVLKALQDADTVFYSVNPAGSSYQLNQMSVFGQQNMEAFANDTGGTAFLPKFAPIDTKDDLMNAANLKKNNVVLEGIFKQLANELRAQYLVQYYSDADYPTGRYVKLDVGLTNPTGRKLRARQGYYVKN